MQYDAFIERVEERTGLDHEDADLLVKSVLSTLGEGLYRTERKRVGSQLPKLLEEALYAEQPPENTRRDVDQYPLEEFYHRVQARSDVRRSKTEEYVGAVMEVLQEAISEGVLASAVETLPADYQELLPKHTT